MFSASQEDFFKNIDSQPSLLVRLPNWIGDVIMTLPALMALQSIGFSLDVYGKPWILDLLKPLALNLRPIPQSKFKLYKMLRANNNARMLIFPNSLSSALVAKLSGKKLIGYKQNCRAILLTAGIKKPCHLHEVEYFWLLAQLAAKQWMPGKLWPIGIPSKITLPIDVSSQHKIIHIFNQLNITDKFIAICPLATGTKPQGNSKIWPYWSELSTLLHRNNIMHIACPAIGEESLCKKLTPYATLIPRLNLNDIGAVFARAQIVLANDTGPMHIAAASGVKTIGIFGSTDPRRTRPWGGWYLGSAGSWPSIDQIYHEIFDK